MNGQFDLNYKIYYLQSLVSNELAGIDLTALFVSIKRTVEERPYWFKKVLIYCLRKTSNLLGDLYSLSISAAALQAPSAYTITQLPLYFILSPIYLKRPPFPYKQKGNYGTRHILTFLAALTASDAKNPDYQPGTLTRAKLNKNYKLYYDRILMKRKPFR